MDCMRIFMELAQISGYWRALMSAELNLWVSLVLELLEQYAHSI
jgi:hypothetical protein